MTLLLHRERPSFRPLIWVFGPSVRNFRGYRNLSGDSSWVWHDNFFDGEDSRVRGRSSTEGAAVNEITLVGVDLGKHVFHLCCQDGNGDAVMRKKVVRSQIFDFFGNLPPCTVAMEACPGSHFLSRQVARMGHAPRLISPASCERLSRTVRTTSSMLRQSARRHPGHQCALCRQKPKNNKPYLPCTASGNRLCASEWS